MGEGDSKGEPTKAGFLADVVWFVYAITSLGILAGLFVSVAVWVVRLLT
jgi:hypothetical protein